MSRGTAPTYSVWDYVYQMSEAIVRGSENGNLEPRDLEGLLSTIEESFTGEVDPGTDYPAFVLVKLCRALRISLRSQRLNLENVTSLKDAK